MTDEPVAPPDAREEIRTTSDHHDARREAASFASDSDASRRAIEGTGLYRLLVESVRDYAIFALSPSGHVLSWNAGAARMKGYKPEEIIGKHFSTFYPAEDIAAGKPPWELEVAEREGRLEDEGWRLRKDGTAFWANVIITALRDETGELVGFAKVTRDLTERRAAHEREVANARRLSEAEAANQAKSAFLAAMSHELRTPLNAIAGYADLLEVGVGGSLTEKQQSYVARIRNSQQHLLRIISDLLNYSRIEAGQMPYNPTTVPVHEIVDAVLPLIETQAAAKGLVLENHACAPLLSVRADPAKAEQIVINLLSNAVKFTPSGGTITISCNHTNRFAGITVSDTGPGIAPNQQESVFEPFVQLGRNLTSPHEGTGLGLAISRELARAMDGELTVESTVGVGCSFTLLMPRVVAGRSSSA